MDIKVNDKPYTVDDHITVDALLPILGVAPSGIAVAVDGEVVPQSEWGARVLQPDCSVVIIKAFYGG